MKGSITSEFLEEGATVNGASIANCLNNINNVFWITPVYRVS